MYSTQVLPGHWSSKSGISPRINVTVLKLGVNIITPSVHIDTETFYYNNSHGYLTTLTHLGLGRVWGHPMEPL